MTSSSTGHVTILDGGMGRQLSRMGAPFRLPEWSALSLIEAPRFVADAHRAFIESGAEVITTNSYAITPDRIGQARFEREGFLLAQLAGILARNAAQEAGHRVQVAGCLPPLFDSYIPGSFDAKRAPGILNQLISGLTPAVDFWLIETQSSTIESTAAVTAARATGLPIWVSYTLKDEIDRQGSPQLRSGETVDDAVRLEIRRGTEALLFNCSQPEVMKDAVTAAARIVAAHPSRANTHGPALALGVYANIFTPEPLSDEPYAGISTFRTDVDPPRYLTYARQWVDAGASIIGGCCGVGPEHIAELRAAFSVGTTGIVP